MSPGLLDGGAEKFWLCMFAPALPPDTRLRRNTRRGAHSSRWLGEQPYRWLMSLDRLLGTWDITMRHVALEEPVVGRQRYERVLAGAFVRLDWSYAHPDFPDAIVMLDDRTCHYFDVRGVVRFFDLDINGSGWTMIRRDADFWQRSAATFLGADAMEGTGENSYDGGATWQHDFAVSYARVA